MLLGFKRRFAPFVRDGSKTHTIRAARARIPRPGEICHCYVDPRQKTMRLLGRFVCVKVERIRIIEGDLVGPWIYVDGKKLAVDEVNALAWRDGFRTRGRDGAWAEMMEFWRGRVPFEGHIIHWAYSKAGLPRSPKLQPDTASSPERPSPADEGVSIDSKEC